ncbi:MAG: antitoxin VapB family protein [archaeon]
MTKVISLSDDAYDMLKKLKEENESFSDVVRRITNEPAKKKLMSFAGMWKDDKEIKEIFDNIEKNRSKFKVGI